MRKETFIHAHPAFFGSELACKDCNPICYKNHGIGKPLLCNNPKCPSIGKWSKVHYVKEGT